MLGTSITPQHESTDDPIVGAHDGDFPTAHGQAIDHPDPSSLGSCSTYHPSRSSSFSASHGNVQPSRAGIRQGIDRIYSPQPLDTFGQLEITSFRYPPDNGYTQQRFESNGMHIGLTGQHHLNSVLTSNYLSHTDAHCDPYLIPMAPATSLEAEIEFLSSVQAQPNPVIPSQGNPLSCLESCAPTATLTGMNVDDTSEYLCSLASQLHGNSGNHSPILFTAPLPYPDADAVDQEMRRLGSFFSKSFSGDEGTRFASPDLMDTGRQNHPSLAPALADRRHSPHRHHTLENAVGSFIRQTPSRHYTEPVPRSAHHYAFTPYADSDHQGGAATSSYANSNGVILDEIYYPQPIPPAHFSGNIAHDQAPSVAKRITTDSSTMIPDFASDNEKHDSSQQTATWDDLVQPSMSILYTQMDMEPSYGQSFDQTSSPFTSTACQSDSFAGPGSNATWSSPSSARELPHQRLPNHRTSRKGTLSSISADSDLAEGFPCSPDNTDEGHFAASSPVLAGEEQRYSSLIPATHPWTCLNAEERFKRALVSSSPLKKAALIQLLRLVIDLPCILRQEFEPPISSEEGQAMIKQIQHLPGCPPLPLDSSDDSIFTLFVAYPEFHCLICGKKKQSMVRGVGCVRKHLEHRPYPCSGDGECKSCFGKGIVERFCSASSLYDHRKKQGRWVRCSSCGIYLKGNPGRHRERCRVNAKGA